MVILRNAPLASLRIPVIMSGHVSALSVELLIAILAVPDVDRLNKFVKFPFGDSRDKSEPDIAIIVCCRALNCLQKSKSCSNN